MNRKVKILIIAALHGDETYGIDLYNSLINKNPDLSNQVSLCIGNQRAYDNKVRFIDVDPNRVFS